MRGKEYIYIPNQGCENFCLKCESDWIAFQTNIEPIKGFKNIDQLFGTVMKKETKISDKEREGFKVSKQSKKNIFVCYFNLWYYVWYNIFRGIGKLCTFVKGIF